MKGAGDDSEEETLEDRIREHNQEIAQLDKAGKGFKSTSLKKMKFDFDLDPHLNINLVNDLMELTRSGKFNPIASSVRCVTCPYHPEINQSNIYDFFRKILSMSHEEILEKV